MQVLAVSQQKIFLLYLTSPLPSLLSPISSAGFYSSIHLQNVFVGDDIKPCPSCQVLIIKMDDGSCNHMTCAVCGTEFCWLCMKEITDLHYLR